MTRRELFTAVAGAIAGAVLPAVAKPKCTCTIIVEFWDEGKKNFTQIHNSDCTMFDSIVLMPSEELMRAWDDYECTFDLARKLPMSRSRMHAIVSA